MRKNKDFVAEFLSLYWAVVENTNALLLPPPEDQRCHSKSTNLQLHFCYSNTKLKEIKMKGQWEGRRVCIMHECVNVTKRVQVHPGSCAHAPWSTSTHLRRSCCPRHHPHVPLPPSPLPSCPDSASEVWRRTMILRTIFRHCSWANWNNSYVQETAPPSPPFKCLCYSEAELWPYIQKNVKETSTVWDKMAPTRKLLWPLW